MSFAEALKEDMLKLIPSNAKATKVIKWEEITEYEGYCDTCWYEEQVIRITFEDKQGAYRTYTYYGTFSDLIQTLTNE